MFGISHFRVRSLSAAGILVEALEAVVSPQRCQMLLREALGLAGLRGVPIGGQLLARFVDGPLSIVLSLSIGSDVTEQLVDQLRDILEKADLLAEPTVEPQGPRQDSLFDDEPTEPGITCGDLMITLATDDRDAFARMSVALGQTAQIVRARSLFDVRQAVDGMLVVDARKGCPPLPELWHASKGREVLVWGAPGIDDGWLAAALASARSWIRCSEETPPEEMAYLCQCLAAAVAHGS